MPNVALGLKHLRNDLHIAFLAQFEVDPLGRKVGISVRRDKPA
jgi:hypothetical protein